MIALENGLSPVLHQAITRATAGLLQSGPQETTLMNKNIKKKKKIPSAKVYQVSRVMRWTFFTVWSTQ